MELNNKNRRGSALAYALIMMAVVSIILVSILQYISSQLKFSLYRGDKEQAFQVAESGMYFYRWYLAHSVSGKTAQQIKDFWTGGNPYGVGTPYEAEFFDPEGGAIGKYQIQVQPPDVDSTIVMVKSTGWTYKEPNAKRVVQARFRRPSWSEYAVAANDVMRFGAGTQVYGKIHSNNGIRFDGMAYNIVSSSMDMEKFIRITVFVLMGWRIILLAVQWMSMTIRIILAAMNSACIRIFHRLIHCLQARFRNERMFFKPDGNFQCQQLTSTGLFPILTT